MSRGAGWDEEGHGVGQEIVCGQREKLGVTCRGVLDLNTVVDLGGVCRVEENDPQASVTT